MIPAMMSSVQGVRETGAKDNDGDSCDDVSPSVRETGAKDNDGDSRDDAFSPRCERDWCQGQ